MCIPFPRGWDDAAQLETPWACGNRISEKCKIFKANHINGRADHLEWTAPTDGTDLTPSGGQGARPAP